MPNRPTEPLQGLTTRTGHFEERCDLGALLGEGGIGSVRCGHQRQLARSVAVKTIRGPVHALYQEAAATAAMAGPGVPSVFGLGQDDAGRPALFMSRVEGRSWRSLICAGGRLLAPTRADGDALDWHLGVLLEVAAVVERAHARGIVHRDIKPGNVIVRADGSASLIDWGLAVAIDARNPALRHVDDIRRIEGTPGCLAPEMIAVESRMLGPRTDVFLLGTCLHMLLTGHVPYREPNMTQRVKAAFHCRPQRYREFKPAALVRIAQRAMGRRPGDRYASVAEFRAALARYRAGRIARRHLTAAQEILGELERAWHMGSTADTDAQIVLVRRHVVEALHLDPASDDAMVLLLRSAQLQANVAQRSLCRPAGPLGADAEASGQQHRSVARAG